MNLIFVGNELFEKDRNFTSYYTEDFEPKTLCHIENALARFEDVHIRRATATEIINVWNKYHQEKA